MPTTRFTVHSSLPPTDVMAVLTDFGPARASRWPNIDAAHFKVHELGPEWAEVTEGTALGWERTRYSWDTEAGTVTIDTLNRSGICGGSHPRKDGSHGCTEEVLA